MKYRVQLTAKATVVAYVEVEAADQDHAMEAAIELAGSTDVTWVYDGIDDLTIEPTFATEVHHAVTKS